MSTPRYPAEQAARRGRNALHLSLILLLGLTCNPVLGEEIARWVDDQGVIHFGNLQFAPADAYLMKVKSANRMDVPQNVPSIPGVDGPTWTVIDKAPKQNRKGWRSKGDGPHNGPVSPSFR